MKKIASIIVMMVLLTVEVCAQSAQTFTPSRDTLPCSPRLRNHYYSSWYDTTYYYFSPETYQAYPDTHQHYYPYGRGKFSIYVATQQFFPRPLRVKGMWAMVDHYHPGRLVLDTNRLPEYLSLYVRDTNVAPTTGFFSTSYYLDRIATVRWDTARPRMMCLPRSPDHDYPPIYCHLYEALFDTVYTLLGEYWIGGSLNSPSTTRYSADRGYTVFDNWPTVYVSIDPSSYYFIKGMDPYGHYCYGDGLDGPWGRLERQTGYGPFGFILDEEQYYVDLVSEDLTKGFVRSTAYYPSGTYQTITATPHKCYRFSHWNDGVTDNPRTIFVTQDTQFIAYFDTTPVYSVGVRTNDSTMGRGDIFKWREGKDFDRPPYGEDPLLRAIGGDTVFCEGDTVVFRAKANPGFYFWYWSDSVRENQRTVTVTQDTQLTAIFSKEEPPPYDPPCPRVVKTLVLVEDTGRVRLMWVWGQNRRHESWEVAWGLAGMPPDSCEIIPCSRTEKLFDNLERGVQYVAYVRALCRSQHDSSVYYSDWSDSVGVYFPSNMYTVTASPDYEERGQVEGGGEYYEGGVAVLTAMGRSPYGFLQWNDGDMSNPRYVVVTQDTSFTALFEEREGITTADGLVGGFCLLPNPASGSVRCLMEGNPFPGGVLSVTDASGREVLHKELPMLTVSHTIMLTAYPKGIYFVTLTTEEGSYIKKLVVE